MKGPTEKNFEGIYANPRLMHAVGLVVGCIAQVQVKSGSIFEGVLRTVSSKADFVLEMARKIENKKSANNPCSTPTSMNNIFDGESVAEKLVFKFDDVVTVSVNNVDPEFATREGFTDTAISKFNGQILERELEPWDGGSLSSEALPDLSTEGEANGWDANDMFRTNEEKYGVKSSFDSNLPGYTIPLNKQNTDEYKQNEARASKIAQEIESGSHHKTRAALENGDEEDRFSAVVRPDNFRYVSHRRGKTQNVRNIRNNAAPLHMNRNSHQHSAVFHRVSSPAMSANNSQGNYKVVNSVSASSCVNTISPRPTPTSTPPTARQHQQQQQPVSSNQVQSVPMPLQQPPIPPPSAPYQHVPISNVPVGITQPSMRSPPTMPVNMHQEDIHKLNGEADKTELKFAPKPPRSLNLHISANKEMRESVANQQISNKNLERRKETEKKTPVQKVRDDKTEDLKRFHARFKLSEDVKESQEKDNIGKSELQSNSSSATSVPLKHNKEKSKEEDKKQSSTPESRTSPDNFKSSNLNPNAKEFVFNPNAKSFTPRGIPIQNVVPPPVQPPPRLHTQSPIMPVPQPHIMPGMPQTVFNLAPQYVVSAPVSLPMAPPFTQAASVNQPPRFRKAMPMTLQRHDLSQPVHVQAATGQPILAQPTLTAAPQFAIQYASPSGMLHHPPGHPQQLAYTQMYQIMPRVIQQAGGVVGMVPSSATYGESPQIPTHVYMPHPGTPNLSHAIAQANNGQHSNPSTPQSQTPNLHPAPSPVHQPPPSAGHGQPPTPTGHPGNAPPAPQTVMYGHMAAAQHPLHANHTSTNQVHPFATSYGGAPQPIVLVSQQPHGHHPATFASSLQNHLHGQTPGSHVGTPTHVLPHAPLTMIPSSAGLVHSQTAISSGHYVPHSQV